MKLLTPLLSGWQSWALRAAVVLGLLGVVGTWVYMQGRESGLKELYAFQAKVQHETDQALARMAAAKTKQKENSDAAVQSLNADLDRLRADYGRVQQQSDARGSALRRLADSSLGTCPDARAELLGRLDAADRETRAVLERADRERIKYGKLWNLWVRQSQVKH